MKWVLYLLVVLLNFSNLLDETKTATHGAMDHYRHYREFDLSDMINIALIAVLCVG